MPPITRQNMVDPRKIEGPWLQNDDTKIKQYRVSSGMFNQAATTVNYDLVGFQAGTYIIAAGFRNRVNWTGGAIATATLSIGTTASPAAYTAATTVFSGAPATVTGTFQPFPTFVNAATPLVGGTVRVQLIVTGANASALLQGNADIYLMLGALKLYFGG